MGNFLHSIAVQLCKYIENGSLSCAQDGSENKLTHCAKTMLHNKASGETKIFQWMIYLRRNMTLFVFVRHTYIIYICKIWYPINFLFLLDGHFDITDPLLIDHRKNIWCVKFPFGLHEIYFMMCGIRMYVIYVINLLRICLSDWIVLK